MQIKRFQKIIWDFYRKNKRDLPWRPPALRQSSQERRRASKNFDVIKSPLTPYRIFVSEVMLQQTQVTRVISKYKEFLKRFPSFQSLTSASLSDVLKTWKGLGYNRRGLNLKRAAEIIVKKYQGKIPKDPKELIKLPGIGPHTAGSILAFAYNFPIPFIETNIRSVFIHFFFKDKTKIHDRDILPLVEKTLDKTNPREWYYALMDYGSHLKKSLNPSKRSLHYVRQAPFKGSHRELRSKILSYILLESTRDLKTISRQTVIPLTQVKEIIEELSKEGFIAKAKNGFKIL